MLSSLVVNGWVEEVFSQLKQMRNKKVRGDIKLDSGS